MPDRPPGSDNPIPNDGPVPKLMKTTTEKAMASKRGVRVKGQMQEDARDRLPKNRESDIYAVSKRGDLVNVHV